MFTIAPASLADVLDVSAVLGSAFAEDTVMSTLVRPDQRPVRLSMLFAALIRSGPLESGRIDVARRDTDGQILGAAIWEHPEHRGSLLAKGAQLPGFLCAIGYRGIPIALRVQKALARHRPAEPHWYLAQIGVSDLARGAGIGSALLDHRLERITADGYPAYLEASNERNRALYTRHGFIPITAIEGVPLTNPTGMWRERTLVSG